MIITLVIAEIKVTFHKWIDKIKLPDNNNLM